MKTYSNRSNTKRAAKKQYGADAVEGTNYNIVSVDGGFTAVPVTVAVAEDSPKGKTNMETDQFGFRVDTANHQFGKMVRRSGGCTMKQVVEAPWNAKGGAFYNAFKKLVEKGLAAKNGQGHMVVA